jgi:CRP/FNR family transcriptional regulator, anaerobic regulatory protein
MDGAGRTARAETQPATASTDASIGTEGDRPALSAALADIFEQAGTLIRLAHHQQLALMPPGDDCSYLVRSGTLALETATPARHILGFWHGDDLMQVAQLPALPRLALRALEASELWRLRRRALEPLFSEVPDAPAAYHYASAAAFKRMMVANTMLGRLNGEERVVSFLVSTALRLGRVTGNRVTMRMPMSRADIADHLGLNPDTLSRIVTGLKDAGLIESHGRFGLIICDWRGLQSRTPIAAALADA